MNTHIVEGQRSVKIAIPFFSRPGYESCYLLIPHHFHHDDI